MWGGNRFQFGQCSQDSRGPPTRASHAVTSCKHGFAQGHTTVLQEAPATLAWSQGAPGGT